MIRGNPSPQSLQALTRFLRNSCPQGSIPGDWSCTKRIRKRHRAPAELFGGSVWHLTGQRVLLRPRSRENAARPFHCRARRAGMDAQQLGIHRLPQQRAKRPSQTKTGPFSGTAITIPKRNGAAGNVRAPNACDRRPLLRTLLRCRAATCTGHPRISMGRSPLCPVNRA